MELPFETLDVFTETPFGGNPLGVFPDAAHLPDALMQRIALEMHLSETVFLGPPETPEGTARVRIFTPAREVPFAGHPTVGAAIYLASRGAANAGQPAPPAEGTVTLVLEEKVGPVPVEVRFQGGRAVFARFTTAVRPEHRPAEHAPRELAAMLGLEPDEVCDGDAPCGSGGPTLAPEQVSCGIPYYVVPVRSLDAVRRSALDLARWRAMGVADGWADDVYVICMEAEGEGVDVHVRMFAPSSGIPEDPATGSAAAALGGYLAAADGRSDGTLSWTVEQGLEMGRPSLIQVEADRAGGETVAVRVGGSAVFMSRGTMRVPDGGGLE